MIAVFAFMFSSIINLPQAMHASSSSVRWGQQHFSSMETRGMYVFQLSATVDSLSRASLVMKVMSFRFVEPL